MVRVLHAAFGHARAWSAAVVMFSHAWLSPVVCSVALAPRAGSAEPIREQGSPTTRIVPTAEGVLHGAAAALASQQGPGQGNTRSGSNSGNNKKYAHVASRLHQETVATLAKKRAGNLPGGAPNLTALPMPVAQPLMAPLSTYVPPSRSTPGPLTASALLAGGQKGGIHTIAETIARKEKAQEFAGFGMVYGQESGQQGTGAAGGSSALAAAVPGIMEQLASVPGSGNVSVQGPSDAPRVVRFERRVPSTGGGDSGEPAAVPVTVVRLPEPVRFDVTQMR